MDKEKSEASDSLLVALVSGSTAALVSSLVTFPFDCVKTQQELNNSSLMKKYNVPSSYPGSVSQMYKGCSALVAGNLIKNSARLISYNWATKFMSIETVDSSGKATRKSTAPRMVIAGMMSSLIETLWIIPFENIKITMIQNMTIINEKIRLEREGKNMDITGSSVHSTMKNRKPARNVFQHQYISPHAYYTSEVLAQYKFGKIPTRFHVSKALIPIDTLKIKYNQQPSSTFTGAINEIYQIKGIWGFTAGSFITMVRQVGITGVWLSTYNATRQLLNPSNQSYESSFFGNSQTPIQLIGLNLLSSFAVIAVTQPLDVIKSHIQSKNGKFIYKDSLSTAYQLFMQQGFKSLWKGSIPRYFKVVISSSLTASVYDMVEKIVFFVNKQEVFLSD